MNPDIFIVDKDSHEMIHIRRKDTKECVFCVDAGMFWLIRSLQVEPRLESR